MNDRAFDNSERNRFGVKTRVDGNGDAWANCHRDKLGNQFLMQDVDCLFGAMAFGHNTAERLFMEYVPDHYQNRTRAIRKFGVVALFDRKLTENAAMHNRNIVSQALYLWICRTLAGQQSISPKFFYVCGNNKPPWRMMEIDINTGEKRETVTLQTENWQQIWHTLGLTKIRAEIVKVIQR